MSPTPNAEARPTLSQNVIIALAVVAVVLGVAFVVFRIARAGTPRTDTVTVPGSVPLSGGTAPLGTGVTPPRLPSPPPGPPPGALIQPPK